MSATPELLHYTFEQMVTDLRDIANQAAEDEFAPDIVLGIARGGLVPATMLSHHWNVPLVVLNITLRDGKLAGDPGFDAVNLAINGVNPSRRRMLVVDDICDGGDTLRAALEGLAERCEGIREVRSATLWHNTAQRVGTPDYHARLINRAEDDRWIVFPWEAW